VVTSVWFEPIRFWMTVISRAEYFNRFVRSLAASTFQQGAQELPPRHKDSKEHKECKSMRLALGVLVLSCQESDFNSLHGL